MLEDWLESSPNSILEDGGVVIIGRQVPTNLGGYIDLLGADRRGNVVVVELKRDSSSRVAIAQALEYASYVEQLNVQELEAILRDYREEDALLLAEHHRMYFNLGQNEAVSFNENQRIVIVSQRVTREISQTAEYLNSKGFELRASSFRSLRMTTRIV